MCPLVKTWKQWPQIAQLGIEIITFEPNIWLIIIWTLIPILIFILGMTIKFIRRLMQWLYTHMWFREYILTKNLSSFWVALLLTLCTHPSFLKRKKFPFTFFSFLYLWNSLIWSYIQTFKIWKKKSGKLYSLFFDDVFNIFFYCGQ